jgi:hypothetical protein
MSPTLQKLVEFLASYSARYDLIINALQAKADAATANTESYKIERDNAIADAAGYKAEADVLREQVDLLKTQIETETELEAAVEALIEQYSPAPVEVPTPVEVPEEAEEMAGENYVDNPTQAQDELVFPIIADPAIDTSGIDTSAVGTSEPTPPEVINDLLVAAAEQAEAEMVAALPVPELVIEMAGTVVNDPEPIAPEQPAAPVEPGTVTFSVGGENAPAL